MAALYPGIPGDAIYARVPSSLPAGAAGCPLAIDPQTHSLESNEYRRRDPETKDVRDHQTPRRREDHADREAPAVWREHPQRGRRKVEQDQEDRNIGLHGNGKQRGISVATSVMTFEYHNQLINILDTPGHKDFAEDTYRTLTAVDSVILVVDCVKGVEEQTERLMSICRMRNTPVIIFVN
jgi:hypothetical protein